MNNFLTNRQISLVLYCVVVGYGVINLPKNIAEVAGTGGWISLIIATVIFAFITYIITYLQYTHEGKTLYEYSQKLVGKLITYIFMAICIIYFFLFFTMIIRIYCETIKLSILNKTPVISLCIVFYIVVCYALTKGINVIARMCEIYGVLNIISFIFINTILLTQGEIIHIRPFFDIGESVTYLKGALNMIFPLLGIEVLLFLPVNRIKNKNIYKYTLLMVGFIGILYIFIVESTISVVGVDSIVNYKANVFSVLKGADITYLEFFRRLDGIYIFFWTMNVVCAVSLWGYGTIAFINKIFKSVKYNYIVVITAIASFIVSQIPKTMDTVELIIKYNSYLGVIVVLVIPVILFLITKVKKNEKLI